MTICNARLNSNSDSKSTIETATKARPKRQTPLLEYAAYFATVGTLVFVAQTREPKQIETALLAGAISAASVVSRDWYKARLDPSLAEDSNNCIGLFNEMLHAGRAQANANAAQLKRAEFLQTDLIEAMRDFNDLLRLDAAEVEQRLKAIQSAHLTSALPPFVVPNPLAQNAINNSAINNQAAAVPPIGDTHVPDSTTLRQSSVMRRPGFDA